jgi:hypothetical protein
LEQHWIAKKLVEYPRALIYTGEQSSGGTGVGGGNGDAARGEISGGRWLRALDVAFHAR